MLVDWIAREGWIFLNWWLLVTVAGFAVLPICWRLLGSLPDKGYTLARPVGLLLVAFIYWLLASYGFIDNTTSGMVLAWFIVVGIAVLAYFSLDDGFNLRAYWQENKLVIVVAELLFLVMFGAWTIYRAYHNDIYVTEKPMEIMFISSIMRSETFPPNDAWMAGYSISYYYFGYVMAAMLSMLSGVSSGTGFSMMIALLFGLAGITGFGVVYNLVRARLRAAGRWGVRTPAIGTGVLAAIFLVFLGNFELPLIEMPYQSRAVPQSYFEFWGVQERSLFPEGTYTQSDDSGVSALVNTNVDEWGYWWWFRASRVLTDYNLDGTVSGGAQPITEFPAFSFILSDVHPHVLAMPFVLMTIGIAFSRVLMQHPPRIVDLLFYGVVIGGLLFLNTWDAPIYLALLVGAEALRRLLHNDGELYGRDWLALLGIGIVIVVVAMAAYLPFVIGFRSQAGGFVPNIVQPTLFRRFFIMFGPLLLLTGGFLGSEIWRGMRQRRMNWSLGFIATGVVLLVLLIFTGMLTLVGIYRPELLGAVTNYVQSSGGWDVVLPQIIDRRLSYIVTSLVLLAGLMLVIARLFPSYRPNADPVDNSDTAITYAPATGFALLLIGVGFGLALVPEFIYLRDVFGSRINTVFKFYYQAWIVLSLVSAYGVYHLMANRDVRVAGGLRVLYSVMLVGILIVGMMYPLLAAYSRITQEDGAIARGVTALTLDGTPRNLPDDYYNAVMCLGDLVEGDDVIVAEATRDTYNSPYGRVGAFTGLPTVINWEGHQRQWRGATYSEVAGTRAQDIGMLYRSTRWDDALPVINRYDIDYIMYGPTERNQYGAAGEQKFADYLPAICDFGTATVYRVDDDILARYE